MPNLNWPCLGWALSMVVVAHVVEALSVGDAMKTRWPQLRQPRFAAPVWLLAIAGVYYALLLLVLGYRLMVSTARTEHVEAWSAAVGLLAVIMISNILWNALLLKLNRFKLAVYQSMGYTAVITALVTVLLSFDATAAALAAVYGFWSVYAAFWTHGIWQANTSSQA